MKCPDTPNSAIGELLKHGNDAIWNKSWLIFYDTYYDIMHLMALNVFKKCGWSVVSPDCVEDIVTKSFISLIDAFSGGAYVPENHRFRGYLKTIIARRVFDFLRSQGREKLVSIDSLELLDVLNKEDSVAEKYFDKLDQRERALFRRSIIMDIWESLRPAFGPETALLFEMRVLEERPVAEICQTMQVDRTRVDKAVFRITQKIKKELENPQYKRELDNE